MKSLQEYLVSSVPSLSVSFLSQQTNTSTLKLVVTSNNHITWYEMWIKALSPAAMTKSSCQITSYPSWGTRATELLMFGTSSFLLPIHSYSADISSSFNSLFFFLPLSSSFSKHVLLLSPPSDPSLPLLISPLLHFNPPPHSAWGQQRSLALSSMSLLHTEWLGCKAPAQQTKLQRIPEMCGFYDFSAPAS